MIAPSAHDVSIFVVRYFVGDFRVNQIGKCSLLKIAVPWSLSHYMSVGGYRPIYRPLFDHAPADVSFSSWNNVKLYDCFENKHSNRTLLERAVSDERNRHCAVPGKCIAEFSRDLYSPANRVLTSILPAAVEFHHTVPFPSQARPFVFLGDSFMSHVSLSESSKATGLYRSYCEYLFTGRMCLGVFFHSATALKSFQQHFSDRAIDAKLQYIPTGLCEQTGGTDRKLRPLDLENPRFLFINSADQNSSSFLERGGHVVLKFWKRFITQGRSGRLVMRCDRPDSAILDKMQVDVAFVQSELGRSIIWLEDYCPEYELDRLMAGSDFFLLPSKSAHTGSLRIAMRQGAIAVTTEECADGDDTLDPGNSILVTGCVDEWSEGLGKDSALSSSQSETSDSVPSLDFQINTHVVQLLDNPSRAHSMRDACIAVKGGTPSGVSQATEFWKKTKELLQDSSFDYGAVEKNLSPACRDLSIGLKNCLMGNADFGQAFESPSQPLLTINTGLGVVYRMGGHVAQTYGNPQMRAEDWSVANQYLDQSAPMVIFANTIADLDGRYIYGTDPIARDRHVLVMKMKSKFSEILMPYPVLYRAFSSFYRYTKKLSGYFSVALRLRVHQNGRAKTALSILVRTDVGGYNIVEISGQYYAAPRHIGAFSIKKALEGRKPFQLNADSIEALEYLIAKHPVDTRSRLYRLAAKVPFLIRFAKATKTMFNKVYKWRGNGGFSD